MPLYAGLGGLVLAVAAGAGVLLLRDRTQPPPAAATPDAGQEQISALTEALAANQVQLAKRRLEDKNYAGAAAQADRALKLDARSEDAKKVLETAQGALDSMKKAEAEARAQIAAKNLDAAGAALWDLLSADPNHAAAAELTGPLDKGFRSRAEEARRLMSQARTAADGAGAGRLDPFTEAAGQVKEGESFFTSGGYARAAQKFLAARDGFERARRMAQH
jgi:hypothetical protein